MLVAYVQTAAGSAWLFENGRRRFNSRAEDGTQFRTEEGYAGLVVTFPADRLPTEWVAEVQEGIRRERCVMERVRNHAPPSARFYHRSKSPADEVAGHSTVVNALKKVDIHFLEASPKTESVEAAASQPGRCAGQREVDKQGRGGSGQR